MMSIAFGLSVIVGLLWRRGPRTASRPRPRRLMRRGHPGCRPPAPDRPLTELSRGSLRGGAPLSPNSRPPAPDPPLTELSRGGLRGGRPPQPQQPPARACAVSHHRQTAGDAERLAGDVARLRRGQEHDGASDVLRLADPRPTARPAHPPDDPRALPPPL